MKKNKLFSGLLALFISASLMLLSCNENDLSDQSFSDSNVSNASLSQKGTTTIEIDKDVAKTVALTFFSRSYDVDIESISIDSEKTIKDFDGKIAIYSFNINPSGFVLVSSNSRNVPIVAHSNEGIQYEYTSQENRYEWLHMNWGWGPNYGGNGWFYQNLINNNGTTITVDENEVNPNFQYNRKCIYSIKK